MNCSDYKEFKLFNGHYYTVSVNKLTFESAKQIAKNNGGYLAIPNSASENNFINIDKIFLFFLCKLDECIMIFGN